MCGKERTCSKWRIENGKVKIENGVGRDWERRVPEWEESIPIPAVFARVANKGVAGYGTWKKVRKTGKAEIGRTKMEIGREIVVCGPCFVPREEGRAEAEGEK